MLVLLSPSRGAGASYSNRQGSLATRAPYPTTATRWPHVSLLPIATISWSGQVESRLSSRVRSPGSSTDAVVLRSPTALTGSDRPRTILAAGAGTPRLHG
jgi:hypothetical protein